MTEILFLAHRIPYPPTKGDKIRSWNLLRHLAERFTVHLGTFIDAPEDWQHTATLERICAATCFRPLDRRKALMRSTRGLLSHSALSLPYFADATLDRWVRDLARRRPLTGVMAFSSPMAGYAVNVPLAPGGRRVIDLCDVDSDKWRQYASAHGWPLSWLYARESRLLAAAERRYADTFDATLVVAEAEAELMRRIAPQAATRIHVVANGVDAGYFDPSVTRPNPFPAGLRPLVFTGAMDYFANADAVTWFAREILPAVRAQVPQALFAIVGSNPSPDVQALGRDPGVLVTGTVPDIRPYLAHAALVVAPLRLARGVQNKVLEALAMARVVVATENAIQGIPGAPLAGIEVAVDAREMTDTICRRLQSPVESWPAARAFVEERYAWDARLRILDELFPVAACAPAPELRPIGSVA